MREARTLIFISIRFGGSRCPDEMAKTAMTGLMRIAIMSGAEGLR
jgi:hypothetical protein